MSIEATIARSAGWHYGERKVLAITVLDDASVAVDVSAVDLRWDLLRQAGDTPLLTKTTEVDGGITVTGDDDNIASIVIETEDYEGLRSTVYRHELWDDTNSLLLAYGDAWVLPGTPVEV